MLAHQVSYCQQFAFNNGLQYQIANPWNLQYQINALQQRVLTLSENNFLLASQLQDAKAENANLRVRLNEMQIIAQPADRDQTEESNDSHSALTQDSHAEVQVPCMDFEEQILNLYKNGNINEFRERLQSIEERCNSALEFKRQFLPFIKEDIRYEIAESLKAIADATLAHPRHPVSSTAFYFPVNGSGMADRVELTTRADALPPADHNYVKVVIAIKVPNSTDMVLGIASKERSYDNEEDGSTEASVDGSSEDGSRKIRLKVKMLPEACERLNTARTVEWFDLCGLIPALRKHEACLDPTAPRLMDSIADCVPTAWPDAFAVSADRDKRLVSMNETQRAVINKMSTITSGGIFNLIGPPGTGKTTTTVHLLAERKRSFPSQKILLTAPSNKAVHVVLEKFLKKFADTDEFMIASLRVEPHSFAHSKHVCPYTFAEHVVEPLKNLPRGTVDNMLASYATACDTVLQRLHYLQERPGLPVNRRVRDEMECLEEEINELRGNFTVAQLITVEDVKAHTRKTIDAIYRAKLMLQRYMLQKAHIVFSTLVASGRPNFKKAVSHFDCVIVDEAAQALIPETLIPLKFMPSLCLLIGDPQQLPGLVQSPELRNLGYAESLMGVLTKGQQRPSLERLTTQYRMHPSICKWVSDQFYEGELIAAESLASRKSSLLLSEWALTKLPSAFVDCDFSEAKGKRGEISNLDEAKVLMNAVKKLLQRRVAPEEIGIIAFYAAQVKVLTTLRKKLAQELRQVENLEAKLTISTVDGFQGDERDFILISCVRTIPSVGFLADHRRINVAMSRAKHARWVFGKASALRDAEGCVFANLHAWIGDVTKNSISPATRVIPSDKV